MNPLADGSSDQASFRTWPELRTMSEVRRSDYFKEQAKQYAMENPKRAAYLGYRKILRTWSPVPTGTVDFMTTMRYSCISRPMLPAAASTCKCFVMPCLVMTGRRPASVVIDADP